MHEKIKHVFFLEVMREFQNWNFLKVHLILASKGIKFHSIEILWCYFFIITLLFLRKKITKEVATRIAIGFFSLFSNLFMNVWILLFIFLLLGLPVEILRIATGSFILNFISTALTTAEHSQELIVGTIFYIQFFVFLYTISKLTLKNNTTHSQ